MKPYSEYKASGVEWLGDVPIHWINSKFKFLFNEKDKTSNTSLSCGAISFGEVVYKDSEKLSDDTKISYQEVLEGEFLINPLNLNYDLKSLRTALSKLNVIVSSGYIVLQSKNTAYRDYLKWLLFIFDIRHMKTLGAGIRQTITFKDIGNCALFLPSAREQKSIAAFLDQETARIDRLIAEKQTFIELLKEKRQALISQVVTKGLNPNVKMKDSGIEWIGEIPEHWEVKKIKHIAIITNGATPNRDTKEFWWNGSIAWLNSSKINDIVITEADQFITELALEKTSVQEIIPNTVLIAITGEGQTRGRVAISKIYATINQHLAAIKIKVSSFSYQYLFFWLMSQYHRIRYDSSGAGSTKGAITCSDIGLYPIPVPSILEQLQINETADLLNNKYNNLIEEVKLSISLLQEHRTALISATVTGKINVQDYKGS